MPTKRAKNEAMAVRKAKAKARVAALKDRKRGSVVSLAETIDPKWLHGPLIFDRVRIPESDLDFEGEDA